MEIIKRDKISQCGDGASLKINNTVIDKKLWYQTWWGQAIIGISVLIAGAILTKYFGLT